VTRRVSLLAAVAAVPLALAACPLPQPLAEVSRIDGGTVTPPRIVVDSVVPAETVIRMGTTACTPGGPHFALGASVDDPQTDDVVEARWFVDYSAAVPATTGVQKLDFPQSANTGDPVRALAPYDFTPGPFDPSTPMHVVEVVVSNNFRPLNDATSLLPNRSPQDGFETQVFRWVFVYDASSSRCAN
jgi:hypothetical protein